MKESSEVLIKILIIIALLLIMYVMMDAENEYCPYTDFYDDWEKYWPHAKTGDIVFLRSPTFSGLPNRVIGNTDYSHVAMVMDYYDELGKKEQNLGVVSFDVGGINFYGLRQLFLNRNEDKVLILPIKERMPNDVVYSYLSKYDEYDFTSSFFMSLLFTRIKIFEDFTKKLCKENHMYCSQFVYSILYEHLGYAEAQDNVQKHIYRLSPGEMLQKRMFEKELDYNNTYRFRLPKPLYAANRSVLYTQNIKCDCCDPYNMAYESMFQNFWSNIKAPRVYI